MEKIRLPKRCPEDGGRLPRPKIGRKRKPIQLTIELPEYAIHDLSDAARYRVHAYRSSPGFFAVRTEVVISVHDLFVFGGVRYKVARCEVVSEGCVEIRGLVFKRLQRR